MGPEFRRGSAEWLSLLPHASEHIPFKDLKAWLSHLKAYVCLMVDSGCWLKTYCGYSLNILMCPRYVIWAS